MNTLDATDLHYLRKTSSMHSLGRLAAAPDLWIPHTIASHAGGYSRDLTYEYRRNGLSLWITRTHHLTTSPERLITWPQVRNHISQFVTDNFREAFRATDSRWCTAKAGPQTPGVLYTHTEEKEREVAELETQLYNLAAPLWHPETTIEREPQQLDLFA
jgi:hypothetical protein